MMLSSEQKHFFIRRATVDDAEAISHVAIVTRSAQYRTSTATKDHERALSQYYAPGRLRLDLAHTTYAYFVAELQHPEHNAEAIIAYALAGPSSVHEYDGELFNIYVLPGMQRHHVGLALWQAVVAYLREQGKRHMWIEVAAANQRARAFYERQEAVFDHLANNQVETYVLAQIWYRFDL